MTKKEFINKIAPYAIKDMQETDVAASLTIAQAALESAWGCSGLTEQANNLFGIKGQGPTGGCTMMTTEYINGKPKKVPATFRSYHNWGESIKDHSKLILNGVSWNRNLYKGVIGKRGADAARAIAAAGYATDPKYAEKLIAIMNEWNLYQYDESGNPAKGEYEVTRQEYDKLIKRIEQLEDEVKLVPAPKWFLSEFGSANLKGLIADPQLTNEGWRTLAIGLRASRK